MQTGAVGVGLWVPSVSSPWLPVWVVGTGNCRALLCAQAATEPLPPPGSCWAVGVPVPVGSGTVLPSGQGTPETAWFNQRP